MTPTPSPIRPSPSSREDGTGGRIRWEPNDSGILFGYAGTYRGPAFLIYPPNEHSPEWLLSCRLPVPRSQFDYANGPDTLKEEAEKRLAGFVSSLGAAFKDSSDEKDEPVEPSREALLAADAAAVLDDDLDEGKSYP